MPKTLYQHYTREELIARIEELETLHLPTPYGEAILRKAFNIRPREATILYILMQNAGKLCPSSYLDDLLSTDIVARREPGFAEKARKSTQVHICRLRNRLFRHSGISIETVWFKGVTMAPSSAQRIADIVGIPLNEILSKDK